MSTEFDDDDERFECPSAGRSPELRGPARQLVEQWRFVATGSRTVDYMVRDFLISSQLRDRRQRFFKHYSKTPAPWMAAGTLALPQHLRKATSQIRALHYLHALQLFQLLEIGDDWERPIIEQLLRCWPVGFQVDWRGLGTRTGEDVCRRPRQCPFCCARSMMKLHRRLASIIDLSTREPLFVLARLTIPGDHFRTNPLLISRERCNFIRHRIGKGLVEIVRSLGVDGGVTSFMVGPQLSRTWEGDPLSWNQEIGFEYKLACLGEINTPTPDLERLLELDIPRMKTFDLLNDHPLEVSYRLISGAQVLRQGLAGTSVSYISTEGLGDFVGAFSWPSWNLASYEQWRAHLRAVEHMRLFDCWGSWICMTSPRSQSKPRTSPPGQDGGERRQRAFEAHNRDLSRSATQKRERLLETVRSLVHERPALAELGRVKLRKQLASDHAIHVSEGDIRWLVSQLKKTAVNGST